MLGPLALVVGALIGFVGSRRLRRPERAARAASVARSVGGGLGRRKGLSAPELQRACFSEMVRHVHVERDGTATVPSRFLLQLHPDDLATVDDARTWFSEGLADALRHGAEENGWRIDGRIELRYEAADDRNPGAPNAVVLDPTRPEYTRPEPAGALALRRADNGAATALVGDEVSIGRAAERDLVIDDKRVSRDHARIRRGRSGWTITDQGSANGTVVNGRPLAPNSAQAIHAGDTIGIGPFELVVEAAAGPSRRPGR